MTQFTPYSDASSNGAPEALRPAQLCAELINALEASEGRRRRRARDTTPDAIGMPKGSAIKTPPSKPPTATPRKLRAAVT